jgi:hypothetical protein
MAAPQLTQPPVMTVPTVPTPAPMAAPDNVRCCVRLISLHALRDKIASPATTGTAKRRADIGYACVFIAYLFVFV